MYAWQGRILKWKGGDEYEGMWKSPQSRYGPGRSGWAEVCLPGRKSEARRKLDICSANSSQPKSTKHPTAPSILFSSIRSVIQQLGDSHGKSQSINQSTKCQGGVIMESSCLCNSKINSAAVDVSYLGTFSSYSHIRFPPLQSH